MVEIADDGANDWMETKCGYKVDREAVDRSRLRVEARKWLMGANPSLRSTTRRSS
jgi:hypothetical protein